MMPPRSARLVTIVIPTIGRDTLQRTIDSALNQTVRCDLVVEHDPARTSCGATLNRALAKVTTPWFMGVADDDMLLPGVAQRIIDLSTRADMIIFQMRYPEGHVLPTVTDPAELACGNVGSSFALRTRIAREIGYLHPTIPGVLVEDWAMISAVRDRGYRIIIVPEVQVLLNHGV